MSLRIVLIIVLWSLAAGAFAADSFPRVGRPYKNLEHPLRAGEFTLEDIPLGPDSDLPSSAIELLKLRAPVRDQGPRGTCGMFSTAAYMEYMLMKRFGATRQVDLSEQWLQYLIAQDNDEEGSEAYLNLEAIMQYGMASEKAWPYNPDVWEKLDSTPMAKQYCGHLKGRPLKSCLVGQRDPALLAQADEQLSGEGAEYFDPEFLAARKDAKTFKASYLTSAVHSRSNYAVRTVSEAKKVLASGEPVILEVEFFYGAWNHGGAGKLGISRDEEQWLEGIVNYPEEGSADRAYSKKDPGGHSIVVVGYDDDIEVTTTVKMKDGSMQTFTHKGVYYFKNSWGTDTFGSKFNVGRRSLPGYGMITQDYAHDFGAFYRLKFRE
jgi:hypothetical protein